MKPILLINDLHDVEHFIQNISPMEYVVVTTDMSAQIHLQENLNIQSRHLSSFISTEEILAAQKITDETIDFITAEMDTHLTSVLREADEEPFSFFSAYLYIFKFHYLEYYCFYLALNNLLNTVSTDKIITYPKKMNHFFRTGREIEDLIQVLFPSYHIKRILDIQKVDEKPLLHQGSKTHLLKKLFSKNILSLRKIRRKISGLRGTCYSFLSRKRPTVLLFPELYDLTFLKQHPLPYNIIDWNIYQILFAKKQTYRSTKIQFNSPEYDNPLNTIIASDMGKFFQQNHERCAIALQQVRELLSKYNITLIAWGNPPVFGEKAFIFDFLLKQNIPIIGMQHGNCYGDQIRYGHFDSDFNRCDYFFTYGFTQENLEKAYPNQPHRCQIIPTGTTHHKISAKKKTTVDILFPLTIIKPLLMGGVNRRPAHSLCDAQLKILHYLNSLNDSFKCYIKPIQGANKHNSPFLMVKEKFTHVHFVNHLSLSEFLDHYLPKIVIIEFPSSPLIDAIGLDTEIFLLSDPVNQYTQEALELLEKRVHCYDNIDDLIKELEAFLDGSLAPKRNDEYLHHYLSSKDAEIKILSSINDILEEKL